MLHDITWSQYLICVGGLLFLYFLGVGAYHFRHELQQLLARKAFVPISGPTPETEECEDFPSYEELKQVASQLRHGMLEEAGNNAGKQQLLLRMQAVLANCDGLRHPASRRALHLYIIREAEAICGISFTEEELEKEWENLYSEELP